MPDTSWPTCSMLDAAEVVACWSPTIACCRWVVLFGWMIVPLFSSLSFSLFISTCKGKSGHQEHDRSSKTVHLHYLTSLCQHPNGMDTIYLNRWQGLQIHRFRNFRRTMVALQPLWRFLLTPDNAISRCPMLQFTRLTVFLATYQWMWHLLRIEGSQRCSGRWSPFQDLSFFEIEVFTGDLETHFWIALRFRHLLSENGISMDPLKAALQTPS